MKKVSDHSIHFLSNRKCSKDYKIKSKKLMQRSTVMDSPIPGPNHVLNMHRMPIKLEYPSTSDYIMENDFPHSLSSSKKSRGRPRVDFHQKPIKLERELKSGVVKVGKRRGRPSKAKGYIQGQLVCSICNFKTEDYYEFEAHVKTHSDQNMYECPYCSSTFSQKGNLMTHIRTHTKEKPFKCLICDFAASQKVNLQVHIRTHTKEKPYKCSVCDFSTAQKCNLIAHRTRRHSNVEVVKTLDNYESHLGSIDSQLKYYRCGMCMFSCRLKREMVDHIKIQHSFTNCEYQTIDVLK